jgi:hypothetical protein
MRRAWHIIFVALHLSQCRAMPTGAIVDGGFLEALCAWSTQFCVSSHSLCLMALSHLTLYDRKSELHAYMDQVLEAVRRDSHNRHVDETHLRKSRLSVLAVKGLSRARIQIYDHVTELPCITALNLNISSLLSRLDGELLE